MTDSAKKRSALSSSEYRPLPTDEPSVTLAVVGAHLRGQPLNPQLLDITAYGGWLAYLDSLAG
jgi:hypothetical protein